MVHRSVVAKWFNPFQPSFALHIETSHFICRAKQMTGFYIKRIIRLHWVNTLTESEGYWFKAQPRCKAPIDLRVEIMQNELFEI